MNGDKGSGEPVEKGVLYVCGTPIGNLNDISFRALHYLREMEIVVCEDTRHSLKLLNYYEIFPVEVLSYHRHSAFRRREEIVEYLKSGYRLALITDAGMPGMSDPGSELVGRVLDEDLKVKVIPGPSAVTAALSVSGYGGGRFLFRGFLSSSGKKRKKELQELARCDETTVLFETPHRLKKTLTEMEKYMPNRPLALVKEVTKHYEQVTRGLASDHLKDLNNNKPRGEYVLVLSPRGPQGNTSTPSPEEALIKEDLRKLIAAGIAPTQAAKSVSLLKGISRSKVYSLLLEVKDQQLPPG